MRRAVPECWVRFHNLPESKRYPENPAEIAELLARFNRVVSAMTHPGKGIVLVTTQYSQSPQPDTRGPKLPGFVAPGTPWRTLDMREREDEPNYWHFFAAACVWHPGLFDPVVGVVAEDAIRNVLVVGEGCRWIVCPYDGGIDVFAGSTAERDRLRDEFAGWLSMLPSGL